MFQESLEIKQNRESIDVDGMKEDFFISIVVKVLRGDVLFFRYN